MSRTPPTYDALRLFARGARLSRAMNPRAEARAALLEITKLRVIVRKLRRDDEVSEDITAKLQAELDEARTQIATMFSERPS